MSAISVPAHVSFFGVSLLPSSRGRYYVGNMEAIERQRLSTDAMGNCTVTLQNVVIGSRYRVEISATGATVVDGVAANSTVDLTVPYYSSGNGSNSLRIKVRNGSGTPSYRPFETQAEAAAGAVLVWVSQELDE